jgi:hypothetical protein
MAPVGKIFISYSSNETLNLTNVRLGMAEPFNRWPNKGNCWNGTFIELRNGGFNFVGVILEDILVENDGALITAIIEAGKELIIENCTFIHCGYVGDELMSYKAPVNVELKRPEEDEATHVITDIKLIMKNVTLKDVISVKGSVQAIYIKGEYTQAFLLDSIHLEYNNEVDDFIVNLDINLPSDSTSLQNLRNNVTFRSKFNNLCPVVDKIKLEGSEIPSYDLLCSCLNISTVLCITNVETSCDNILKKDVCETLGAAINGNLRLECVWLEDDSINSAKGKCILKVLLIFYFITLSFFMFNEISLDKHYM